MSLPQFGKHVKVPHPPGLQEWGGSQSIAASLFEPENEASPQRFQESGELAPRQILVASANEAQEAYRTQPMASFRHFGQGEQGKGPAGTGKAAQ